MYENNAANTMVYAGEAVKPDNAPALAELTQRVDVLHSILSDAMGELAVFRDRTLGATPRGVTGAGRQNEKPAGQFADLLDRVSTVLDVARSIREEASVLNARI